MALKSFTSCLAFAGMTKKNLNSEFYGVFLVTMVVGDNTALD
jgi:hypothetical protein